MTIIVSTKQAEVLHVVSLGPPRIRIQLEKWVALCGATEHR